MKRHLIYYILNIHVAIAKKELSNYENISTIQVEKFLFYFVLSSIWCNFAPASYKLMKIDESCFLTN